MAIQEARCTPANQDLGIDSSELGRLVNAVIWPGFSGRSVPQWLESALQEGLAGVVYFSHNFDPEAPGQLARLSDSVRTANPLAVIGCDEEGGNVTRLEASGGSSIPGAAALGRIDDVGLTEAAGRAIGAMCRDAGINLVLAPVADVNTNPLNPVIGVRSFGASADLAARHTAAMITGIQSAGVGACAKHFPGHGDTVADSHLELPTLRLTLDELAAHHLPPFRQAVAAGVKSIMTAHIVVPELGPAPATLNPAAGSLLRDLGFTGLQITDALDMAAIRATTGSGRGSVLSLLAGADLLCLGNPEISGGASGGARGAAAAGADAGGVLSGSAVRGDEAAYLEVREAILAAVLDGTLPLARLRSAGRRVADFAGWAREAAAAAGAGPTEGRPSGAGPSDQQPTADAPDWVSVAAAACTYSPSQLASPVGLPPQTRDVLLVDARRGHHQAAGPAADLFAAALSEYLPVTTAPVTSPPAPPAPAPRAGQSVVVLVGNLAEGSAGLAAAQAIRTVPGAVCVNTGISAADVPPLPTINCFGYSRATARAVARLLCAGLPPRADQASPAQPHG
jgi:beta-N-acetylhexosaminidase